MKTKTYQTTINVLESEKNEGMITIDFDGQAGEYSESEWMEQLTDRCEDGGYNLTTEEAHEILAILANTSNFDFFVER
jgi:hypothetical protein